MPFETDDGRPLETIPLAQTPADGYRFEVREPVVYLDPGSGRRFRAPVRGEGTDAAGLTDLASVPSALWSFVASYGRQSAPAIVHDARALDAFRLEPRAALAQRRDDDAVFRRALREQGVPRLRAALMWGWVSVERHLKHAPARGGLLLAQLVLSAAAVLAASVLAFSNPLWLLLALAPAFAALLWGRDAPLLVLLGYSAAAFGPLLLMQLGVVGLFRLVEMLVEVLAGGDPGAVVRPTVRPARRVRGRDQP